MLFVIYGITDGFFIFWKWIEYVIRRKSLWRTYFYMLFLNNASVKGQFASSSNFLNRVYICGMYGGIVYDVISIFVTYAVCISYKELDWESQINRSFPD